MRIERGVLPVLLLLAGVWLVAQPTPALADDRPNVVVIMLDDLGYSDFGSYGGEIRTPNIDQLADHGLRFTEFYNAARCCPTRAALLTGQYPHRVGLARNGRSITRDGLTMAEALQQAGYQTAMSGKWHLTALNPLDTREQQLAWLNHQLEPDRPFGPRDTYPASRGFQRFYGTIFGVVDFFDPWSLVEGMDPVADVDDDYYVTDATSDKASAYIRKMAEHENPFFLYVAYHAPHWPLHARPEDIARYDGVYDDGWAALRQRRFERQLEMGLFDRSDTPLPPVQGPDERWEQLSEADREHMANLMEVHAAMVDRVDQGVGQIVETLKQTGRFENTVILVLADNGASPERYLDPGYDRPSETRSGEPIQYRGRFDAPGSEQTWGYIGRRWSSAVNTPFRYWKAESYKGGMQTPLIVHWPAGLKTEPGALTDQRGHVIDIMPTVLQLADAEYPAEFDGRPLHPMDGKSLLPILQGESRRGHETLYFEHEGHKGVVRDQWKLNQLRGGNTWRLYNLAEDRTETTDVAAEHPDVVETLKRDWRRWAEQVGVPD